MTEIPLVSASSTKTKKQQQKKESKNHGQLTFIPLLLSHTKKKESEIYNKLALLPHLRRGSFSLRLNRPSFLVSQLEFAYII